MADTPHGSAARSGSEPKKGEELSENSGVKGDSIRSKRVGDQTMEEGSDSEHWSPAINSVVSGFKATTEPSEHANQSALAPKGTIAMVRAVAETNNILLDVELLVKLNRDVMAELAKAKEEIVNLKDDIAELRVESTGMRDENIGLKDKHAELQVKLAKSDDYALKCDNDYMKLLDENDYVRTENLEL